MTTGKPKRKYLLKNKQNVNNNNHKIDKSSNCNTAVFTPRHIKRIVNGHWSMVNQANRDARFQQTHTL